MVGWIVLLAWVSMGPCPGVDVLSQPPGILLGVQLPPALRFFWCHADILHRLGRSLLVAVGLSAVLSAWGVGWLAARGGIWRWVAPLLGVAAMFQAAWVLDGQARDAKWWQDVPGTRVVEPLQDTTPQVVAILPFDETYQFLTALEAPQHEYVNPVLPRFLRFSAQPFLYWLQTMGLALDPTLPPPLEMRSWSMGLPSLIQRDRVRRGLPVPETDQANRGGLGGMGEGRDMAGPRPWTGSPPSAEEIAASGVDWVFFDPVRCDTSWMAVSMEFCTIRYPVLIAELLGEPESFGGGILGWALTPDEGAAAMVRGQCEGDGVGPSPGSGPAGRTTAFPQPGGLKLPEGVPLLPSGLMLGGRPAWYSQPGGLK